MKSVLTDNVKRELTCSHCNGNRTRRQGLVCLDVEGHGVLAPCPMCKQGEAINRAQYGLTYWTEVRSMHAVTWQNGLTAKHRSWCQHVNGHGQRCFRAAINKHCDYHADPVNRGAHKSYADVVQEARDAFTAPLQPVERGLRRGAYIEQEATR